MTGTGNFAAAADVARHMASDDPRQRLKRPERAEANVDPSATPTETGLPAIRQGEAVSAGDAVVGAVTRTRPIVVVTAIALKRRAREALADRLGPGHIVVDIREAGPDADIVLVPPSSPTLIGLMRGMFPKARLLATEFTDDAYGANFRGPISRILESDIDGYFIAPTMEDLAQVTRDVGHSAVAALTAGTADSQPHPADLLQANRRALEGGAGTQMRDGVVIDLEAWALDLQGDADMLAELAWPLILQLKRQGLDVTVVGDPPDAWNARARQLGVQVRQADRTR